MDYHVLFVKLFEVNVALTSKLVSFIQVSSSELSITLEPPAKIKQKTYSHKPREAKNIINSPSPDMINTNLVKGSSHTDRSTTICVVELPSAISQIV